MTLSFTSATVKPRSADTPAGQDDNILSESGSLKLTVTDEAGNSSSSSISLSDTAIFGLETLRSIDLQVDREVNILGVLSFADGVNSFSIVATVDGSPYEIGPDGLFTPEYPGTCEIVITAASVSGAECTEKVEGLIVKPLEVPEGSVRDADIVTEDPDILPGGVENFKETGVYKAEAIILESIENGTV